MRPARWFVYGYPVKLFHTGGMQHVAVEDRVPFSPAATQADDGHATLARGEHSVVLRRFGGAFHRPAADPAEWWDALSSDEFFAAAGSRPELQDRLWWAPGRSGRIRAIEEYESARPFVKWGGSLKTARQNGLSAILPFVAALVEFDGRIWLPCGEPGWIVRYDRLGRNVSVFPGIRPPAAPATTSFATEDEALDFARSFAASRPLAADGKEAPELPLISSLAGSISWTACSPQQDDAPGALNVVSLGIRKLFEREEWGKIPEEARESQVDLSRALRKSSAEAVADGWRAALRVAEAVTSRAVHPKSNFRFYAVQMLCEHALLFHRYGVWESRRPNSADLDALAI